MKQSQKNLLLLLGITNPAEPNALGISRQLTASKIFQYAIAEGSENEPKKVLYVNFSEFNTVDENGFPQRRTAFKQMVKNLSDYIHEHRINPDDLQIINGQQICPYGLHNNRVIFRDCQPLRKTALDRILYKLKN